MLVSTIADLLDYEMVGKDCDINGISWFDVACENEIAVAHKKSDVLNTKARVVLTKPVIMPTEKTLLITFESIECALVNICKVLIQNKVLADYLTPTKYQLNEKGYYVGKNCKISTDAIVQPGVMIGDNVTINADCVIEPHALIGSGTVLEQNVYIGSGSKIGAPSFYHYYADGKIQQFFGCGIVKISKNTCIGCNTIIQRGTISDTILGSNCMIGNCIDIGHDVKIGDNCKIVSQTGIAGGATIKNHVLIYGQVAVSNDVVIGNNVIIKGKTFITKTVNDNEVVYGAFGRNFSEEMKLIAKVRQFFNRKER